MKMYRSKTVRHWAATSRRSNYCLGMAMGLWCGALSLGWGQGAAPAPVESPSMFRNFVGTCQGSAATPYLYDIVGWDRSDVFWPEFEDKEGQWEQKNLEKLGQKVLEMRAKGVTFLPILDYNTAWSSDKSERTYDA